MTQRLWLVNLVLLALAGAAAWKLREDWRQARRREELLLGQKLQTPPGPPLGIAPPPAPLAAAQYLAIAQQVLFSKDRNPNVEEIVVAPPQMPSLPTAHGVFLISSPPTVLLSPAEGAPHKGYRPGDQVGEFKLISVSNADIEFEWNGQIVRRSLAEITPKLRPPAAETGAEGSAAPSKPQASAVSTVIPAGPASSEPGVDIGGGLRACQPGDTSPSGTVSNGMRKVVSETPFGKQCRWEPAR